MGTRIIFLSIWLSIFFNYCNASENFFVTSAYDRPSTFHVAQISGKDSNPGSSDAPFATISKCAKVAYAGDTCIVHAGSYRETVRPHRIGQKGKPITFLAASNEKVRVTGLDKLSTRWIKHSPGVFVTKAPSDVRQLFVNDTPMRIARFPNSLGHFEPTYATIVSAKCLTATGTRSTNRAECMKYDEDGPCSKKNNCWDRSFPKNSWQVTIADMKESPNWEGGIIAVIDKGSYNAERAMITQPKNSNIIEFEWYANKGLEAGMKLFITNALAATDSDGEWSYNSTSGKLYFDPPGSDIPPDIFIQTRDLAFDLRGKHHIVVKGFEIFSASIETDQASTNCILEQLDIKYPVYHQMFGATSNFPGQGPNRHKITSDTMGKGITLGGRNNTLQDSKIAHSWCDGVTVYGSENQVLNNDISDVNWGMTVCAAVATNGDNHLVRGNRLHHCGRSCLWHQKTTDSEFSYNDIFDACWLGKDCGVTGSNAWFGKTNDFSSDADGDGVGNSIHHNWIHSNSNPHGGACLYLDNNEQDYLIHHNVLWNCQIAMIMNDTYLAHGPTGHKVYNNTCFDVEFRYSDFGRGAEWKLQGVHIANNLCTTSRDAHYNAYHAADVTMENNIGPGNPNLYGHSKPSPAWRTEDLGLIDPEHRDFRPGRDSPARNRGKVIPGIAETDSGSPDAGAYEYGAREAWQAGQTPKATLSKPQLLR